MFLLHDNCAGAVVLIKHAERGLFFFVLATSENTLDVWSKGHIAIRVRSYPIIGTRRDPIGGEVPLTTTNH